MISEIWNNTAALIQLLSKKLWNIWHNAFVPPCTIFYAAHFIFLLIGSNEFSRCFKKNNVKTKLSWIFDHAFHAFIDIESRIVYHTEGGVLLTKQIGHGLFIGILSLLDILSTSSEFIGFDMKSLFWSFENVVWARVKMTFPVSIFLFLTRRKELGMRKHLIPKFQWKSWCSKYLCQAFTEPVDLWWVWTKL